MREDSSTEQGTIKELLLECGGITAIECVYHSKIKGRWLFINTQRDYQRVKNYINDNLSKIHNKKKRKKKRDLTHSQPTHQK